MYDKPIIDEDCARRIIDSAEMSCGVSRKMAQISHSVLDWFCEGKLRADRTMVGRSGASGSFLYGIDGHVWPCLWMVFKRLEGRVLPDGIPMLSMSMRKAYLGNSSARGDAGPDGLVIADIELAAGVMTGVSKWLGGDDPCAVGAWMAGVASRWEDVLMLCESLGAVGESDVCGGNGRNCCRGHRAAYGLRCAVMEARSAHLERGFEIASTGSSVGGFASSIKLPGGAAMTIRTRCNLGVCPFLSITDAELDTDGLLCAENRWRHVVKPLVKRCERGINRFEYSPRSRPHKVIGELGLGTVASDAVKWQALWGEELPGQDALAELLFLAG